MKCKFIYNNRVFESEADLDEYLIVTTALKPSLGDIVFKNWSKQQLSTYDKIQSSEKAVEEAIKRGEIKTSEEQGEPEDMDGIKGNGRYKSITELIHEIRTVDSNGEEHPLFPIFIEDNYWNGVNNSGGQLEKYRQGRYDDPKVAAQIPFVEDLIPKVGGQLQPVTDSNTLQKIRERMTDVWKQQAICGDLVHAMLSDFYKSKTDNGRRFSNLSDSELKQAFKRKLKEDFYQKYQDYVSDSLIDSMVKEAQKIDKEIREKYGDDCMILSEKKVVGTGNFGNNSTPIVGKMDLFVISSDGRMGILDFKCSPKEYSEFNDNEDPSKYDPAKIRTFQYQLAAYRKLLNSIGVNSVTSEIELGVIPLQFQNYRFNTNTKKVEFDKVSSLDTAIQILPNSTYTTGGNLYHTIESNLEQIFPTTLNLDNLTTGEILSSIKDEEKILFKELVKKKNMTDEDITKYIQKHGGVKKNKITNNWEFKPYKSNERDKETINGNKSQAEAEALIFDKVKQKFQKKEDYIPITTASIRKSFKQAMENGDPIDFHNLSGGKSYSSEDPLWLQKQLGKYNNDLKYTLLSSEDLDPILDQLGILLFKNRITGLVDVVKISEQYDPTVSAKLGGENSKNRNSLLGTFIADEVVNADSNSQVMEGIIGNVEIMEAMLLINKLPQLFNNETNGVGRIELMSPRSQKGLTATNEQLLDNFRRLCKLGKITNNFIDEKNNSEGIIRMATHVDNCLATFQEILESPNTDKGLGKIYSTVKNEIKSCISDLDSFGENPQLMRQKLIELDRNLIETYPQLKQEKGTIQSEENNPEYKLHRDILFAISELSGVKLLQQIEDHAKFTLAGGISGTEIDNPGTLQSKTLNEFTDQVTKAYQNVRDNVIAFNQELRSKVEALKKAKGFGLAQQYTVGNQVSSLYQNMFDKDSDDLIFVNPWDNNVNLSNEERDFLKFAILKINDNRIKNFDPKNIENLIKSNPAKYLRVPLVKGDLTSEIAIRGGWMNFIRSRFAMLSPSKLKERFDRAATNLLDDSQQKKIENEDMWEAINSFDASEDNDDYRRQLLSSEALGGKSYFEHNIETLLLKHTSAYKMADELNDIFPVLRALTLNLNAQGAILNDKFQNDLEYILKYVKTRIHNQPIENRKDGLEQIAADVTKTMMSTASKLALAFNPRQWYQFLDGIWKDCQLYFRNAPEEGTPFTKEGLLNGWKLAMSDLAHFGNTFTMGELLNQQYGFNDMDANSYIEKIKTDNTGLLYHFWNVGFRFASRPDYYNRMTIFYAQMHKDGSLDAHKMVDGKLVYDWTKDKRFDAFAKGDKSNLEKYNQQKSLYITMGQQFEQEGARNEDGSLFKLDLKNIQSLPKAYTNQQSEGMKALSDRIYGYYAHEKKSMIHSSLVGAMLMQMNTYWSAKKNQYAQTRSFTQEGDWAQYEENGQLYYWKEDEDGDLIPTTEVTGVPLQVWKGRPQEGIFLTGFELMKAAAGKSDMTSKSGIAGMRDLFNNEEIDPQIRRLYSSNMRQLISDLLIWLLIGNLLLGSMETQVTAYAKASGNDTVGKAFTNTLLSGGTQILKASTLDANFMESIFGRGRTWTPFAVQSTDRLAQNLIRVGTGKQDLYDFLIRSNGSTNATRPMWDYVKVSTLGRKIGEHSQE